MAYKEFQNKIWMEKLDKYCYALNVASYWIPNFNWRIDDRARLVHIDWSSLCTHLLCVKSTF